MIDAFNSFILLSGVALIVNTIFAGCLVAVLLDIRDAIINKRVKKK